MHELTSRERFMRMYEHREADRVPIIDSPWTATLERWVGEGMPKGMSFVEYFGLDRVETISVDNSPQFETETIEETDEYRIYTTPWGATLKNWTHAASTPEFIDFTITDPESWKDAKSRMSPDRSRVDWKRLEKNYAGWKKDGVWINASLWFGFDVTHSWHVGTERVLMALVENPQWCMDMFSSELELDIAMLDMVWDAGYEFDAVTWCDDMGYKHSQFFSVDMYRELVKPYHRRAIEWAHAKGIKTHLHSCGDVNPFVPELIEIGLDALNPLEVKAGMDPVHLKKTYGDELVFHGGINAVLWTEPDKIRAEMESVIPVMKEKGGYIFSSDHSVPSSVSLEDFRSIIEHAKTLGSYD